MKRKDIEFVESQEAVGPLINNDTWSMSSQNKSIAPDVGAIPKIRDKKKKSSTSKTNVGSNITGNMDHFLVKQT